MNRTVFTKTPICHVSNVCRTRAELSAATARTKILGRDESDLVTLASDVRGDGEALIAPMMRQGKRIEPAETLEHIRERTSDQLASLPRHLTVLDVSAKRYCVEMSPGLKNLAEQVDKHFS